jgi:hypothetical protein
MKRVSKSTIAAKKHDENSTHAALAAAGINQHIKQQGRVI